MKKEKGTKFVFVCGAGYRARELIAHAREAGMTNNVELDRIGIEITRLNALTLRDIFAANGVDVAPIVPKEIDVLRSAIVEHRVVVCGGFVEGSTTDTDSAMAAETANCKLIINVSHIGYVHDRDPKKFSGAEKKERLTYEELIRISSAGDERKPGSNVIFDEIAAKLAARSMIEIRFVDGKIENFDAAVHGKPHNGTTVK